MLREIKVNELRKRNRKHAARNTIANKTVAKREKARGKKQETGNKKHIVE